VGPEAVEERVGGVLHWRRKEAEHVPTFSNLLLRGAELPLSMRIGFVQKTRRTVESKTQSFSLSVSQPSECALGLWEGDRFIGYHRSSGKLQSLQVRVVQNGEPSRNSYLLRPFQMCLQTVVPVISSALGGFHARFPTPALRWRICDRADVPRFHHFFEQPPLGLCRAESERLKPSV
jgi:hypothetical protein